MIRIKTNLVTVPDTGGIIGFVVVVPGIVLVFVRFW